MPLGSEDYDFFGPILAAVGAIAHPLNPARRFKHVPEQFANMLGDIQDASKLTGTKVPLYHGTKEEITGPVERRTTELTDINPDFDEVRFEEIEKLLRDAHNTRSSIPKRGDLTPSNRQEELNTVNDLIEELEYERSEMGGRTTDVPSSFYALDPQLASKFGPNVYEEIVDVGNVGYSPWDIKGLYQGTTSSKQIDSLLKHLEHDFFEGKITGEHFDKQRDLLNAKRSDAYDKHNLVKQGIFDANRDRSGMFLDPLRYTDPLIRETPTYPSAHIEDHLPQAMIWDDVTKQGGETLARKAPVEYLFKSMGHHDFTSRDYSLSELKKMDPDELRNLTELFHEVSQPPSRWLSEDLSIVERFLKGDYPESIADRFKHYPSGYLGRGYAR